MWCFFGEMKVGIQTATTQDVTNRSLGLNSSRFGTVHSINQHAATTIAMFW
jgi:hypothetical protein